MLLRCHYVLPMTSPHSLTLVFAGPSKIVLAFQTFASQTFFPNPAIVKCQKKKQTEGSLLFFVSAKFTERLARHVLPPGGGTSSRSYLPLFQSVSPRL